MKATGIVRKVDNLGRMVLPKELRETRNIEAGKTPMEIYVDDDGSIILKKYEPGCTFCDSVDDVVEFKGKKVCGGCRRELTE